jgi:hypothetical protein
MSPLFAETKFPCFTASSECLEGLLEFLEDLNYGHNLPMIYNQFIPPDIAPLAKFYFNSPPQFPALASLAFFAAI